MNTLKMTAMAMIAALITLTGCQSEPLMMEKAFDELIIGQTTASEVLDALPAEGMMHTSSSVSVYRKRNWAEEVGIVQFSPDDSTVIRTDYVQTRSEQGIWFSKETLLLKVETLVPAEVLEAPYENDMRKFEALMRYCHEQIIEDGRPFLEDRVTESKIGVGRMALATAILELNARPRNAATLADGRGFEFKHPTLGSCAVHIEQQTEDLFTLTVTGASWVDPFTQW